MNIKQVANALNKEFNANINTDYYKHIEEWRQWWAGYVKSFHTFYETTDTGKKERKLYTMKMAKKICEDWASYLLNEKTKINIDHAATSKFLLGEETEQREGGVLGDVNFWEEANRLVEKAFYSGTGAFVLKLDNLTVLNTGSVQASKETELRLEYLPATCILPITVRYGNISEVAFASKVTERGEDYVYVEIHTQEDTGYVIENRYYQSKDGSLTKTALPAGIVERIHTGSPYPFFSIIKPNVVNVHDNQLGLGCSVFANAIDNLKGTDIAYNNFNRDLWLGGKKVFYNRELTKTEIDKDGKHRTITPDDMLQQLFVSVGDEFVDDKKLIHEFNPSLRVQDNKDAVQAQLDYLSFMCGMGTRHYQFDNNMRAANITATQYVGEKQELKQNASKHGIVIEKALQDIIRAILWAGKFIKGEAIDPDAKIKVEFSDGYVISDEEKRAQDKQDVLEGLMMPWEYRMKWYNESEEDAKAILEGHKPTTFGGFKYPPGEDDL